MAGAGMSVPGATDLGLGSTLSQQVADETEEERKKRLLAQAQQRLAPGAQLPSVGASSLMGGYSAAVPFP
jgi:hypothetical protein